MVALLMIHLRFELASLIAEETVIAIGIRLRRLIQLETGLDASGLGFRIESPDDIENMIRTDHAVSGYPINLDNLPERLVIHLCNERQ